MVMNAKERTNTLKRIKESGDNIGNMNIVLHGEKRKMETFEVPLDSVIFNKENGRIRTKVLTHENLNGELNQEENHEDEEKISGFIWDSSVRKNKETLESLKNYGQQTACVVTADGVIVGGNRRVCCMRRLTGRDKPTFFETVILDEKYDGNKSVLLKLEKILQHGVDSQEDYGANEKYYEVYDMAVDLGAKQNANKKWSGLEDILDELTQCMPRYKKTSKSASVKAIEEDLRMKDLFDEYLNLTKAPGIITQLDKKEGYFVDLLPSIDSYKPDHDAYADRKLKRAEIAKWKEICFYVTKAQFQGGEGSQKLYRDLFKRDTKKHGKANMFGNSKSWEFIKKEWEEKIDPIIDKLSSFEELQKKTQNPQEEVQREESKFQTDVEGPLTGIFKQAKIIIDEDINKISAEENLQKAWNYLSKINADQEWPPEKQNDDHAKSIKDLSNNLRKISEELYKEVKDW
tara:strand:+ start:2262 stop:3641 length:1380 start_codon:yes stop_codon:yes gene_type:complete